jgi:hypothetical protein
MLLLAPYFFHIGIGAPRAHVDEPLVAYRRRAMDEQCRSSAR